MTKILRYMVALTGLFTADMLLAQVGYLGHSNVVSVDVAAPLLTNTFEVQYTRVLFRRFALRGEWRMLMIDDDLQQQVTGEGPGSNWLGFRNDRVIGTTAGSGNSFGVHTVFGSGAGVSLPLGYYFSLGADFFSATFTQHYNNGLGSSLTYPFERKDFDYECSGWRLVASYGQTMLITDHLLIDAGLEVGFWNARYTALDSSIPPATAVPYDRYRWGNIQSFSMEDGTLDRNGGTEFTISNAFFYIPRLKLGYVF